MAQMVEDRLRHLYPRHIVSVSGVVTTPQGRVLLVKGDRRGWEPPGGQVELGEDLLEALQREIREESGVEVAVLRLAGVYSNLGRPDQGLDEQVNFTFGCEWVEGEPRAGDECTEAAWFEVEEAKLLVTAPQQGAKLGDALSGASGVRYRAYKTYPYEVWREGLTERRRQ